MKKFISILLSSLLVMSCFSGFAAPAKVDNEKVKNPVVYDRVQDLAEIFSKEENTTLTDRLEELSAMSGADMFLVTVESFEDMEKEEFSKYAYETLNGKKDGIIFILQMSGGKGNRDYVITTFGKLENMMNAYCREEIINEAVVLLGDDDYIGGMSLSLDLYEKFYKQAETGEPYSEKNPYITESQKRNRILIAIGLGVVVSLIVVFVMKGQLKSVRPQPAASEYVKDGSFNIREQRDVFLYSTQTRTAIPKNDSSSGGGASSSGSSSSGKF